MILSNLVASMFPAWLHPKVNEDLVLLVTNPLGFPVQPVSEKTAEQVVGECPPRGRFLGPPAQRFENSENLDGFSSDGLSDSVGRLGPRGCCQLFEYPCPSFTTEERVHDESRSLAVLYILYNTLECAVRVECSNPVAMEIAAGSQGLVGLDPASVHHDTQMPSPSTAT